MTLFSLNWIPALLGLLVVIIGVLGLFSIAPFSATVLFTLFVLVGAGLLAGLGRSVPPP